MTAKPRPPISLEHVIGHTPEGAELTVGDALADPESLYRGEEPAQRQAAAFPPSFVELLQRVGDADVAAWLYLARWRPLMHAGAIGSVIPRNLSNAVVTVDFEDARQRRYRYVRRERTSVERVCSYQDCDVSIPAAAHGNRAYCPDHDNAAAKRRAQRGCRGNRQP